MTWSEDYLDDPKKYARSTDRNSGFPVSSLPKTERRVSNRNTDVQYNSDERFAGLQLELTRALDLVDDMVLKSYVPRISQLEIYEPSEVFNKEEFEENGFYFIRLTRMVYEKDEFSISKFSTIFQALSIIRCTLCFVVQRKKGVNELYLGVRGETKVDSATLRSILDDNICGQFPGSKTQKVKGSVVPDMSMVNSIASVTKAADYKTEKIPMKKDEFVQGIENFINTVTDNDYTAIFIANSVSYEDLEKQRLAYEEIYTQISPFANMQLQFSKNESTSEGTGVSENKGKTDTDSSNQSEADTVNVNVSKTHNRNETKSQSKAHTDNASKTTGKSHSDNTSDAHSESIAKTKGFNLNAGLSIGHGVGTTFANSNNTQKSPNILKRAVTAIFGGAARSSGTSSSVMNMLNLGGNIGGGYNQNKTKTSGDTHTNGSTDTKQESDTKGYSDTFTNGTSQSEGTSDTQGRSQGKTQTRSIGHSVSNSFSLTNSENYTDTFGSSHGTTLNAKNMTLNTILKRLDKLLERIECCESSGMWDFSAYFLSDNSTTTHTLANSYYSLISGKKSGLERSAVNIWNDSNDVRKLKGYLKYYRLPLFKLSNAQSVISEFPVDTAALISTDELALSIAPPRRSVSGLPVTEHAAFGQEVVRNSDLSKSEEARQINIGKVYHLNHTTNEPVALDLKSLTMHTFVTGSTGAGKSNTVYHILDSLDRKGVRYLVVEPAKGEYRDYMNACVYGTNPKRDNMLRLDPFSFPEDIHVLEHIDKLTELFNVCWPMYAAMPAVLKDSIIRAYESSGWDINTSENAVDDRLFPTFKDVLRELENVVNDADYSSDTSSDYKGALKTRLRSLTNGINGMIFVPNEIKPDKLFDENVIVDISRVGSVETKSLIMGVLVLKLQEYRMSSADRHNADLRHVTVLEEAHNILKKTSTEQSQEGSNIQGKSVEMLTNAIAEMRTYGEGFIIADQAPELLDTAVIRNTNTKIILRLPEERDRKATGGAVSLKEPQIAELAKLPTGVAAVYQNNWHEAVLCKIPEYKVYSDMTGKHNDAPRVGEKEINIRILRSMINKEAVDKSDIIKCTASGKLRYDIAVTPVDDDYFKWCIADFISETFNIGNLFYGCTDFSSYEELGRIMMRNVSNQFRMFNEDELSRILYYVCLEAEEKYPDNEHISCVREVYFKPRLVM